MKKYYLLSLTLTALMLGACGGRGQSGSTSSTSKDSQESSSQSGQTLDLSVACPSGAPAIALSRYINDTNLDINADATNVVAYMKAGSKDIIVLPTNAGVSNIKQGATYKIASTITFGNFYLASTGNDEDETLNEGDYVVLFQQNNVPDKLFKYVYGDILSSLDIHYVNVASDAAKCIVTGKDEANDNATVDYVLIAEPALSKSLSKNPRAKEYSNIQTLYSAKAGDMPIMQASIFVKNGSDEDKVDNFLSTIQADIQNMFTNPDVLDGYVKDLDSTIIASKLGSDISTIKDLIKNNNRLGLGYKDAFINKGAIDNFLSLWPAIGETSEEIYYK